MVFNSDLFLISVPEILSSVLTLLIHLTTLASFFSNLIILSPLADKVSLPFIEQNTTHATGIGFDLDFVRQNFAR